MKYLILSLALMTSPALAYNANHRPFPDDAQPERIPLAKLPDPIRHDSTNEVDQQFIFEISGDPPTRIRATRDEKFFYVDLSIQGQEVIPRTAFSIPGSVLFEAYAADLNQDGRQDYILSHWQDGCGLASGYDNLAVMLSTDNGHKLTVISALWRDNGDYMRIDGKSCILHTSFHMVDECTDGKSHNFWIYNLLAIDGDQIRVANELHPDFPKTIWYSFAPNHDETTLLSDEQKQKLLKSSQEDIFWIPSSKQP